LIQSSYHKEVRAEGGGGGGSRLAGPGGGEAADGYRSRVLAGSRVLERTGESLHRATQVAVETEVVGGAIIEDLGSQREALERTRNRLIETDLELSKSRRILQRMYLNVISNKIILLCIILSECGILGGLIYWKWFAPK
jgi:vesicle transport through interaction with t-SNAREs protein 1